MRRLSWFALGWSIITACGVAAQPSEIVPSNGSFEQLDAKAGLPAGWSLWNPTGNLTAYSLGAARTGVAAASVTDDSATDSQGLRSPRVPITAGRAYVATGYVWVTDLQAGGFSLYLEFWQGGDRVLDRAVSTSECGQWVKLEVTAIAPAGATEATVLVYGSSATIGHAYFDDVSVVLAEK